MVCASMLHNTGTWVHRPNGSTGYTGSPTLPGGVQAVWTLVAEGSEEPGAGATIALLPP